MATKQWTPKTRDELKKLIDGGHKPRRYRGDIYHRYAWVV